MSELTIEIYRGNTKYIELTPLSDTDESLILGTDDKVIFAIKGLLKTYIRREFTKSDQDEETGVISFRLSPDETMAFPPGVYTYDCLYVFSDPVIDPYTFIGPAQVIVQDVAAKIGDEYDRN